MYLETSVLWSIGNWFKYTFVNGYDYVPQLFLIFNIPLSPITFPVWMYMKFLDNTY
jgi:membrane-bound metal-dependent hydrolase YbcI (DUF457 family)